MAVHETLQLQPVGEATALGLCARHFGQFFELKLLDYNHGGMGAWCEKPINVGATMTFGFASPGMLARQGVVVDCHRWAGGWRLGIRFNVAMAA